MKETMGDKKTVEALLLGDGPRTAPIHAMVLNKATRVGNWCTIALSSPMGTASVEKFQKSGQDRPPLEHPQMKEMKDIITSIGNEDTMLWLNPHSSGYLLPANVLTSP